MTTEENSGGEGYRVILSTRENDCSSREDNQNLSPPPGFPFPRFGIPVVPQPGGRDEGGSQGVHGVGVGSQGVEGVGGGSQWPSGGRDGGGSQWVHGVSPGWCWVQGVGGGRQGQGQVGPGQVVQDQAVQGPVGLCQVVQGQVVQGQVVHGQVAQGPVVQGQVQVDQGQGQGPISLQGIQDPRVDGSQLAGIVGEGGFGLHFRGGERTKLNPEKKNFKGQGGERFELNSGKRKFRELGGEQSEDEVDCGGLDFQEQNTDRSAVGDFEFSGSEEIGVKKKKRASGAARKRQKRRSSEGLEKKNEE